MRSMAFAALAVLTCGCASDPPAPIMGSPLCVSGTYWGRGDHGDNHMHPGGACITCHTERRRGPVFTVAGTLYNARHEEDDCNGHGGVPGAAQKSWIVIVDQSNVPFAIEPNASGNFYTTHQFRLPLQRAWVVTPSGQTVEMPFPPDSGDCNRCHTREGSRGAEGRIAVPNMGR